MSNHTPQSFVQATCPNEQVSIGIDAVRELYATGWHKDADARTIAGFQLSTLELVVPFPVFHHALEQSLGRPVQVQELALDPQSVFNEFNKAS